MKRQFSSRARIPGVAGFPAVVGIVFATGLSLGATACGGTKPAESPADESPEALLDEDQGGESAPASSEQVQRAKDALMNEDYAKAKQILEEAVAANADDAQAVFYLGVAESGLGETDAAIEHLGKALKLDPQLNDAALNLSALLLDQERYEEALEAAEQGLKVAPQDVALLQNKAMALLYTGAEADAAPILAKVVQKKPDDEGLRFLYAQALLASGDGEAAKAQLSKLTESKNREVLASVADLLGRLKAWKPCVRALDGAIAQQDASELRVKRGLCLHGQNDEDGAKADFEKAIELDPNSAKAHFYLGHNLRERGDKKGARAAFQKAAKLDADGPLGKAASEALQKL